MKNKAKFALDSLVNPDECLLYFFSPLCPSYLRVLVSENPVHRKPGFREDNNLLTVN
jgi:hypothetical protein